MRDEGIFRSLLSLELEQAMKIVIHDKEVIQLSSINYLGLTAHPRIKLAAVKAVETYGVAQVQCGRLQGRSPCMRNSSEN